MSNFAIPLFLKIGMYSAITLKKAHKTFADFLPNQVFIAKQKKTKNCSI